MIHFYQPVEPVSVGVNEPIPPTPPLKIWRCYYSGCSFASSGRCWDFSKLEAANEAHIRQHWQEEA